ncbi:MAG: diacylglycerol kinase [Candidatus Omnitrophica bacterium]|nr:diacylglycerol kinase [Candidatus Omnitrophota bacterium]
MPTGRNNIRKSPRILRHLFKLHGLKESFGNASKGIIYLFFFHRNMRIIFILGILALLSGLYFKLKGIELVALCITVTLVLMAEIFNTSIEMFMDMVMQKYHIRIKLVKDIAAAVVLLAAMNAIAVGYVLFIRRIFK